MADSAPSSKSAKRNAKRRAKKAAASTLGGSENKLTDPPPPAVTMATREEEPKAKPTKPVDPVADLKRQIDEAKSTKDHEKAHQLRQQLWVLQDTMATGTAGPGAPELDVAVLPQPLNPTPSKTVSQPSGQTGQAGESGDPTEKKIHRLRKKLEAINALKQKQDEGVKLETNQLTKLEKEAELLEEIRFLEDLLQQNQIR